MRLPSLDAPSQPDWLTHLLAANLSTAHSSYHAHGYVTRPYPSGELRRWKACLKRRRLRKERKDR